MAVKLKSTRKQGWEISVVSCILQNFLPRLFDMQLPEIGLLLFALSQRLSDGTVVL